VIADLVSRAACETLDAGDRLAPLRDLFSLGDAIYLDGNSLGALPRATAARIGGVIEQEWGRDLIRSWNTAGWITLHQRVGDKIARLVGVGPGELTVADSTSINLYKVLSAAVAFMKADAPARTRIVSERANFPSDLYIADSIAREHGFELVLADADEIRDRLDHRTAVVLLTHVSYRTGRVYGMRDITRAAHDAGALMIWDLAHTAGVMPIDLDDDATSGAAADFAIGCGYKYLNGGPGAPAFVWAHPRYTARMDRENWRQPLSGWLGHAAPFAFTSDYQPANGIARFVCGTPPVLSLAALECGVDTVLAAEPLGGLPALRARSIALTDLFIRLVESRCSGHDLTLVSPRDGVDRGSQVGFAHPTGGYAMVQALIARGVIGDFRAPDILRFGVSPLYTRFVDVWDAVDQFRDVLESGAWRDPRFAVRAAVT
jgi:kynureninase